MTTERDHNVSGIKIKMGIGEVTITIHDHLQRHYKIHPSRIFGDNLDQILLTLQYLTGLEIENRATIYPTTRNSQLSTTETSQTWFDSLQRTMKLMNYGTMPFKLLRSPSSTTNQSKNSRLSVNLFYFATGDTRKDSGLEIEFMLDTRVSNSIINYRTFGKSAKPSIQSR